MAEPYDAGLLPRTYFRAPRVPFDFRALMLGMLGFLVYYVGGKLISGIMAPEGEGGSYDVPGAFLAWSFQLFHGLPYIGEQIGNLLQRALHIDPGNAEYGLWEYLIGGFWFVGVWSFFAQGIHRITTMRIARDEGMPVIDALKFSAKNWPTVLLAPVIIAGTIGIFYVCNMAAGALIAIPGLGGVLGLVLVPLAFVSTLLMLLIGLGGVFGLPLIGAAAAWECNGSLDAISRAFSYLFARPLQYFWNFFLIFLFTGVIILVGSWFSFTFSKSIDAGVWDDVHSVMIDAPTDREEFRELDDGAQRLYEDLRSNGAIDGRARRAPDSETPAMDISTVGEAPWYFKLNAIIFWVFFNVIWLGVSGYAIYWLLGAATSVYADLRADVDGTEEDDVYIEEEEQDLDDLAEGGPVTEAAAVDTASSETSQPSGEGEGPASPDASPDADTDSDAGDDAGADSGAGDDAGDAGDGEATDGGEDAEKSD
jgi:hypothetical protein